MMSFTLLVPPRHVRLKIRWKKHGWGTAFILNEDVKEWLAEREIEYELLDLASLVIKFQNADDQVLFKLMWT